MDMELKQSKPFIINQDSLEQQFKERVDVEIANYRILFSGPFGHVNTFLDKVLTCFLKTLNMIAYFTLVLLITLNNLLFHLIS